ncbi:MAG: rhomboid family intramembrane serine protease [Phycisphaerae bacterium]|nr:rhomboid family intramembrane serine protease [Phycisphaerae bacterium]
MIPLGTDRPSAVVPRVTVGILAINTFVWIACIRSPWADEVYRTLALSGIDPHWWQYATYQFVHDRSSVWHLLGNAVFFWAFGSALERRFGSLLFATVYLALGTAVGALYSMVSGPFGMLVGASGTVCACAAAFAVFYPRARVLLLFWGFWRVPALWFVAIFAALDFIGFTRGRGDGVAYEAHLLGFALGGLSAFVMLWLKVLPRDDFDLFFILRQWKRRTEMRSALAGRPGGAFESASRGSIDRVAPAAKPTDDRIPRARAELSAAMQAGDWTKVVERVHALTALTPHWSLAEPAQVQLANGLHEHGQHGLAADAYANLLRVHPRSVQREVVQLMLATICVRYLRDLDRARATIALLRASPISVPTAELLTQLELEVEG